MTLIIVFSVLIVIIVLLILSRPWDWGDSFQDPWWFKDD